jgi:Fe-Mn family superoxide dismutase
LKIDNNVFGSGWVWLVLNQENELHLYLTANQDNPLQFNLRPVLGIDMWEHAYYLDYFNNKKQYVEKLLTILNWEAIEQRFNHYIGIN